MATFYPALLLQREIKAKVIGDDFWRRKNEELDWLHGNTERKIQFSYLQKVLVEAKRVAEGGPTDEELRAQQNLEKVRIFRAEKRSRRRDRRRRDFFDADRGSWHQVVDRKSGKLFWHNYVTRKSMWNKPPVLINPEEKIHDEEEQKKQEWIDDLARKRKEEKQRLKKNKSNSSRARLISSPLSNGLSIRTSSHRTPEIDCRKLKKKTRKKIRIKRLLNTRVSPTSAANRKVVVVGNKKNNTSIITSSRRVRKK